MFVVRGGHNEIGYRSHISQIECSVMSRTVFSYQSSAVQAQYYIEFLYRYIVNHIVIGTLHERRIDIAERQ